MFGASDPVKKRENIVALNSLEASPISAVLSDVYTLLVSLRVRNCEGCKSCSSTYLVLRKLKDPRKSISRLLKVLFLLQQRVAQAFSVRGESAREFY